MEAESSAHESDLRSEVGPVCLPNLQGVGGLYHHADAGADCLDISPGPGVTA